MQTPKFLDSGGVLQAGIPMRAGPPPSPAARLLRGVVLATYVTDDPDHPYTDNSPCAVYCDVLIYSQSTGSRAYFIPQCLVSQPTGGLQQGRIWKPRAATLDVTDPSTPIDPNRGTNPANMDGDHVLVGFLDDSTNQPIILRGLPHPSSDIGNSSHSVGHRLRLTLADGDPDFVKHHGTFYGVSDTGDFTVDTTFANDGTLQSDGSEPAIATDGSVGNHLYNMEQHCQRLVSFMDMSSPDSPNAVLTELLDMSNFVMDFLQLTPNWSLQNSNGNALTVQDVGANTTVMMGDGSKHVPIVEALQAFWANTIKPYLDAHTHPTSTGPSGPPAQSAPGWDSTINSSKISIPNG